jgi:hypothetical protein
MLKRFVLRNYKNFKDDIRIEFDQTAGYQFSTDCIADGIIGKMLIYGRNATGKTNLGKALMDIHSLLLVNPRFFGEENFLNADSKEKSAMFSYTFQFGKNELTYRYTRLKNQELEDEELNIAGISIFRCNHTTRDYQFEHLDYIGAETANLERYLQSLSDEVMPDGSIESQMPFLRWLISNVAFAQESIMIQLSNYVRRMIMITAGNASLINIRILNDRFYESLEANNQLQDLEDFLNAMGIICKLAIERLPDGQRELYFVHNEPIPFRKNASSGTLALYDIYRRLIFPSRDASFIYLDEFDAFYHYEMSENVISYFKKCYPNSQMIMTSHNTNLMTNRLMRPDCVFILSRSGSLTSLCNATQRELREGHNLEKMYISGEFEKYE